MSYNIEYCDPFSVDKSNIWMKLEHCGRYLFAADFLSEKKCQSVMDLACANGYGSMLLSEKISEVWAADRNQDYMASVYLRDSEIHGICFDFDGDDYPAQLPMFDSIVCFETIEHLKYPMEFLNKIRKYLSPQGWLILSFPNAAFERFLPDGTNKDPYHLHVMNKDEVMEELENLGFHIVDVLGQTMCNVICSRVHDMKETEPWLSEEVDSAFTYTSSSLRALSKVIAYPDREAIQLSYSYIIVARRGK